MKNNQKTKRPLIFLHGFMQKGSFWNLIVKQMGSNYQVWMPDFPGHGKNVFSARRTMSAFDRALDSQFGSSKGAEASVPPKFLSQKEFFSFDEHVRLVHDLVQYILASQDTTLKPLLVGYSFGGRVAAAYACQYPDTLSGLVLESAGLGPVNEEERVARAEKNNELAKQLRQNTLEEFVDAWDRMPIFASQKLLPQAVQEHQRDLRLQNKPTQLAASLKYAGVQCMPNVRGELLELDLPWLYLAGALDIDYVQQARALQQEIGKRDQHKAHSLQKQELEPQKKDPQQKGSRSQKQNAQKQQHKVVVVDRAGHNIHLEQSPEYCYQLENFFKHIDFDMYDKKTIRTL